MAIITGADWRRAATRPTCWAYSPRTPRH